MTTSQTTEFASPGAVHAQGEPLPIRRCNTCSQEIVFCTSKRTGRRYPVSVSHGYKGQRFYIGANVHRCEVARQESTWQTLTIEQKQFANWMAVTTTL